MPSLVKPSINAELIDQMRRVEGLADFFSSSPKTASMRFKLAAIFCPLNQPTRPI